MMNLITSAFRLIMVGSDRQNIARMGKLRNSSYWLKNYKLLPNTLQTHDIWAYNVEMDPAQPWFGYIKHRIPSQRWSNTTGSNSPKVHVKYSERLGSWKQNIILNGCVTSQVAWGRLLNLQARVPCHDSQSEIRGGRPLKKIGQTRSYQRAIRN